MWFSTIFEPFESVVAAEESAFESFYLSYLENGQVPCQC
jgi:hypothetical protein